MQNMSTKVSSWVTYQIGMPQLKGCLCLNQKGREGYAVSPDNSCNAEEIYSKFDAVIGSNRVIVM